jgi:hypothetical protein
MVMTPQQAKGTGRFFAAILLSMSAFALVAAVQTGESIMFVAGLALAVAAIIGGLALGLVTMPLLWLLARLSASHRKGGKS